MAFLCSCFVAPAAQSGPQPGSCDKDDRGRQAETAKARPSAQTFSPSFDDQIMQSSGMKTDYLASEEPTQSCADRVHPHLDNAGAGSTAKPAACLPLAHQKPVIQPQPPSQAPYVQTASPFQRAFEEDIHSQDGFPISEQSISTAELFEDISPSTGHPATASRFADPMVTALTPALSPTNLSRRRSTMTLLRASSGQEFTLLSAAEPDGAPGLELVTHSVGMLRKTIIYEPVHAPKTDTQPMRSEPRSGPRSRPQSRLQFHILPSPVHSSSVNLSSDRSSIMSHAGSLVIAMR